MRRRNFFNLIPLAAIPLAPSERFGKVAAPDFEHREYWVSTLVKIAKPVLTALSQGKLKELMPVEVFPGNTRNRKHVTHLEAFGRLMCGMAPWLELGADNTEEGKQRGTFINLALASVENAVIPQSPDFMDFHTDGQALVDAAFLAHGFIRAQQQIWGKLDQRVKSAAIQALKSSRAITPGYNNWLLFSAMVEAFLLKTGNDADLTRIQFALKKHSEWYVGDGTYGDGEEYHWDYYNSFVIQPMLLDIVKILVETGKEKQELYDLILKRAQRYAVVQERLISPEGTFPPIGRSLAYRFGAFQTLAQIALMKKLPGDIQPAQVRGALSAVINRMINAQHTFDKNGWLQIGFVGHQPEVAEDYISTGSLYLCTAGLLPLGLPAQDEFWTASSEPWTSKKIWAGQKVPIDKALK